MSLPVPNLDDRRFQDLVDEAKRLVQQRCPEWTDHNVSDPGVTLIEAFAMMTDQLLYRLNRVPDLHYLRFLDLIGVKLHPPTAARTPVTYWLSAARDTTVGVPRGSQVATDQSGGTEAPVVFRTEADLAIVPCSLALVLTGGASGRLADQTPQLISGEGVRCFQEAPADDDCVYFGLSNAVPRCAVQLRVACHAEGVGVDPEQPPWIWEAFDGTAWTACEIESDSTGGFNQDGITVVHVPPGHREALLERQRAGWLRVRLVRAEDRPFYRDSPRLMTAVAATIGGTIDASHAGLVADEVVGLSEGVPGQRFRLAHRPVVTGGEPLVVEIAGGGDWEQWHEVESFTESGPDSRHFTLDAIGGELRFGPAVRLQDGTIRNFGAVPPKAAPIRVPAYRSGGGKAGNVARGLLNVQRDPIPFTTSVVNRGPATGGVDGESVGNAAARGPMLLRTRDRAVTVEDYEYLAKQAAPDAARVRCVPVPERPGEIRLLVVPDITLGTNPVAAQLTPDVDLVNRIGSYIEPRRCLGATVRVGPPQYDGVTVVAQLRAAPGTVAEALRGEALEALYAYLNPVSGGLDGTGWPFGRPVQSGEVFAVLQRLPGTAMVEDVQLFAADLATGRRSGPVQRIELAGHALVFSFQHQVRILEGDDRAS